MKPWAQSPALQNKLQKKKKVGTKEISSGCLKEKRTCLRGDFTPRTVEKPATTGAVAVSVCYCVSLDKLGFIIGIWTKLVRLKRYILAHNFDS